MYSQEVEGHVEVFGGKGARHQTPMCPEGVGIEAHAPGQHFWRSVATGARVQCSNNAGIIGHMNKYDLRGHINKLRQISKSKHH